MTLETLLMIALSVALLGGSVAFGLWLSRDSHRRLREAVAKVDRAYEEASSGSGLSIRRFEPYEHPIIGSWPAFPMLVAEHEDLRVRVVVESLHGSSDASSFGTFVVVDPKGGVFATLGTLRSSKRERRFSERVLSMLRALEDRIYRVRMDDGAMRIEVRGTRLRSFFTGDYELWLDPKAIARDVDDIVAFARALRADLANRRV